MAEDAWAAFKPEAAGSDPWAAFKPEMAPTRVPRETSYEVPPQTDDYNPPGGLDRWRSVVPPESESIPQAFLDRLHRGQIMAESMGKLFGPDASMRMLERGARAASTEWDQGHAGFSGAAVDWLTRHGVLNDTPGGKPGALDVLTSTMLTPVQLFDNAFHAAMSGVAGVGGVIGQAAEELSGEQGMGARAEREVKNFVNWRLTGDGMPTTYQRHGLNGPEPIGDLPKAEDFQSAADALKSDAARDNLRTLWEERGLHPAEVTYDALRDPWLKQQVAPPSVIVAFHGSPHDFDKFSSEKIGTGEGAQSYGHGLYFAESKGVAQSYRKSLSGGKYKDQSGSLYRVRINADPEQFLDYDKPLRDQTQHVRDALRNAFGDHITSPEFFDKSKTHAGDWLDGMETYFGDKAKVSRRMNEAGIPGIKYYDASSRGPDVVQHSGGGYGIRSGTNLPTGYWETREEVQKYLDENEHEFPPRTSNFVVFDDGLIQITHKNGVAMDPTKITPPTGSPVPEGTPRSELAKTGEPHIDKLLDEPALKRVIDNPVVDRTRTVPNSWGGSVPMADPTTFIDREFPHTMTVDGVTFDPAEPAAIHENIEEFVMQRLMAAGMDRDAALRAGFWGWGQPAEHAWYRAHGIDPAKVEELYAPILDRIAVRERGDYPDNLFRETYPEGNPDKDIPGQIDKPRGDELARAKAIMAAPEGFGPAVDRLSKLFEISQGKNVFAADLKKELGLSTSELESMLEELSKHPNLRTSGGYGLEFVGSTTTKSSKFERLNVGGQTITGITFRKKEPEPAPVGAAITPPDALPPDAVPPAGGPPPPLTARLAASGRAAMDHLFGLAKNIQYLRDPMSTGSKPAMVIAKDAMDAVRRIQFEHAVMDRWLTKSFDKEQLTRMWNAADEESVGRQLGEIIPPAPAPVPGPPRTGIGAEHMGLATLEPAEKAAVDTMQRDAQIAWQQMVDVGGVEGEGLPAYTPRMVLNVAAGAEHLGPQVLNELGQNVFTRTAQMRHRKYLTAEETEAAAKEMVAKKLEKQGASPEQIAEAVSKVQIGRDIRSLPLATARLKEAAVWRTMINKIEEVGKAAGSPTVAVDFKPKGWFTVEGNPAFTKWEPALVQTDKGTWEARVDDNGQTMFIPKPLYMAPEFKGPMMSILDEGPAKSVLVQGTQSLYGALMALKAKSMTVTLNSPLIHNAVVWSKVAEAATGREWLGFGLYFRGNRIVNNPGRAGELVQRGLAPIGPRGAIQDITGIMEQPDIMGGYHESWTGKVLSFIPGLFDAEAGVAVERAIAKAGDFVHNTLLWDRVRDLQFGLADFLSDHYVAKGVDRLTADRVAAHFSNIIVGSIPKEAMSAAARATANMLLFSRSFTLGNLSVYKQAAMGLPKPILAQIERDFGMSAEAAVGEEGAAAISQTAKSIARRKALSTVMLSAGLYYVGNALLQNAFNVARSDNTWWGALDDEVKGYADRFASFMDSVKENPFELRHAIGRMSPVYQNEPNKQDRVHIGYTEDGTALYARNPVGKYGEELLGYPTMPIEMLKRKLSPFAGGILEILENDKGFGQKIYDPNDTSISGDVANIFRVAKHLVMRHLPEQQIGGALDLLRGEGDAKLNALRVFGPAAGFTVSTGAPGGQQRGEYLAAKGDFQTRFSLAWPDIKRQVKNGDLAGARAALDQIGVPPHMQFGLIRQALNPAAPVHGRALMDFMQYATPEQRSRFENAR